MGSIQLIFLCMVLLVVSKEGLGLLSSSPYEHRGPYKVSTIPIKKVNGNPPKPLLVSCPNKSGNYAGLILQHGFFLSPDLYRQLMEQVASYGYIVIAPKLSDIYEFDPSVTSEIRIATLVINWLENLQLPKDSCSGAILDISKIVIAGHSRGGKVAFGVVLGDKLVSPIEPLRKPLLGLFAIDPVDGALWHSHPSITSYPYGCTSNHIIHIPTIILGTGLGSRCAPKNMNHLAFFNCTSTPAYHMVAAEYGHCDMLDDSLPKHIKVACMVCVEGHNKEPMRMFVGGAIVSFLESILDKNTTYLDLIFNEPSKSPISLKDLVQHGYINGTMEGNNYMDI